MIYISLPLDAINELFQNVATTDSHKSSEHFNVPVDCPSTAFQFCELSVEVVLSHLTSLDASKSTGPDGLSACFLKQIATEIAEPLTDLQHYIMNLFELV